MIDSDTYAPPSAPAEVARKAFAEAKRVASHLPGSIRLASPRPIASAAVIGAGSMGSGIALSLLGAGIAVLLADAGAEALERGRGTIASALEGMVRHGRITPEESARRLSMLQCGLGYSGIAATDLVIEAVFEDMTVKRQVFAEIDAVARPGAVLATNTSFLDVDEIASATLRPADVIGLHFFSPAHVMPLLEVVQSRATAPDVVATGFALAGRMGKVGVLSKVCHGFIANRMMLPRGQQADAMALEGTPIAAIDRALVDFGFAMGYFRMMDLIGLDVLARGLDSRTVLARLVSFGRLGQKSGAGYYDYDGSRQAMPSNLVAQAIVQTAADFDVRRRPMPDPTEVLDRLLLPIVNEGARILQEGIALRASDIDLAAILGYNWPVDRGGPMFWAEQRGLGVVVARLHALAERHGPEFLPCELLVSRISKGRF